MFRRIIVTLFLAFEASLLWLCITLDWNLIDEHLGDISCILPNYSRNISIAPSQNLGRYLAGDSEFALLYNYGLPLPDGVVGGWAAWPLEAPSSSFQISSSKGILYAIYTYCDDPEMSSTKLDGTRLTYRDPVNWHGAYSAFVDIIYPAGSHSIDNWNSSDISQSCEIKLFSASASVKFSFIVDEWLMVTGGQIQSITAGNLTAYQSMAKSHRLYYDDFETGIERKDRVQWSNMTQWIAGGFENVFDGYIYHPSQGSAFVNLMQWATLPDGLYHPENTWKGVSAAIAAIAHYVTLQYENESNDIGTCESYGYANSGMIIASEAAIATCMCKIRDDEIR